jgi:hypothetical protein
MSFCNFARCFYKRENCPTFLPIAQIHIRTGLVLLPSSPITTNSPVPTNRCPAASLLGCLHAFVSFMAQESFHQPTAYR